MNICDYSLSELESELTAYLPAYKVKQLFNWLYTKKTKDLSDITTLSKEERDQLKDKFQLPQYKVIKTHDVSKFQIILADGLLIESVVISEKEHDTLCVSSQVGCPLGCSFCVTATLGFKRNLTCNEIITQFLIAKNEGYNIGSFVFMGMGEPLLNIDNVLKAISILHDEKGANIGMRHFTISTAGVITGIHKLMKQSLKLNLAISLNAPEETLRNTIMPVNKKYPLDKLLKVATEYMEHSGRRVTFEYVLIAGVNDSVEHLRLLTNLLKGKGFHVNLIPYNENTKKYKRPTDDVVKLFATNLEKARINTTIRYSKGQEVNAACGMLGNK